MYGNVRVQAGLTKASLIWAFCTFHASNWHPVTWLSHMLDCQMYGLKAGGHHFTSVLLHVANVLLLFAVLRRMTGAIWRSALVGAVCLAPPACRIGGLDSGTQGRAQHLVLFPGNGRLCAPCRNKRRSPPGSGGSHSNPLFSCPVILRPGAVIQAHGGDVAVRAVAAGLLAASSHRLLRSAKYKIKEKSSTPNNSKVPGLALSGRGKNIFSWSWQSFHAP